MLTLQCNLENMEAKNINDLAKSEFSDVRIAVDFTDYDIENEVRLFMPFVVLPFQYSNIWNFYKKNRTTTTIEAVDEHHNRLVGSFNLITH